METFGKFAENIFHHPIGERPEDECVYILYGTHTGNSQELANDVAGKLAEMGLESRVYDMGDFKPGTLKEIDRLLIIVSTDGDGEPPLMAEDLLAYLYRDDAPDLSHISYSVLALGDSCYDQFCQAGKNFDSVLEILGGRRLYSRVDCDVDFEENYADWISQVIPSLLAGQERLSDTGTSN